MNSDRWVDAYESASRTSLGVASDGRRAAIRSKARRSGQAPSVCTAWKRGTRESAPMATVSPIDSIQALARAPPPTWTTSRSGAGPFASAAAIS